MAGERSADDIQREIEDARVALAGAVDEIAYRTDPKRITRSFKQSVLEKANSAQGRAIIAGAGLVVAFVVVRRFRKN